MSNETQKINYYEKIKSSFFGSLEQGRTRSESLIHINGYFWGLMELSSAQDQVELEISFDQVNKEIMRGDY